MASINVTSSIQLHHQQCQRWFVRDGVRNDINTTGLSGDGVVNYVGNRRFNAVSDIPMAFD